MSARPSARIFSVAALTAAILGVTGCYGQTDLATHIGIDAATLNARGAANKGPADVYFEYWKSSTPQTKLQTPTKTIPGGVSGPFAQQVSGLDDQTAYSFRLCGGEQSNSGPPVCAQTRSFFTGLSSVQAYGGTYSPFGEDGSDEIDVNVVAAPPGGSASGRVFSRWHSGGPGGPPGGNSLILGSTTTDNVTCVNVQGNVAVIGYRQVPPFPDSVPIKSVMHAYVVDGGPAGAGQDRFRAAPTLEDEDPNDCTIPANVESLTVPLRQGEAAVSEVEATSPD
jgi:hypothetical protein